MPRTWSRAALIGGTLPVLVKRALAGGTEVREGLGRLYGANTLGAVVRVSRPGDQRRVTRRTQPARRVTPSTAAEVPSA